MECLCVLVLVQKKSSLKMSPWVLVIVTFSLFSDIFLKFDTPVFQNSHYSVTPILSKKKMRLFERDFLLNVRWIRQTHRKMARKVCVASLFRLCTYIHAPSIWAYWNTSCMTHNCSPPNSGITQFGKSPLDLVPDDTHTQAYSHTRFLMLTDDYFWKEYL